MVAAALALLLATPLDAKSLIGLSAADLEAKWGAAAHTEDWRWIGPQANVPSFATVEAFRASMPQTGWDRTLDYAWRETPSLQSDGLAEVRASYRDGQMVSLSLTTLPKTGFRAQVRDSLYASLSLPAPTPLIPTQGLESFTSSVSAGNVDWKILNDEYETGSNARRSTTLRTDISRPLDVPEKAAQEGEAFCMALFATDGAPETIEYDFLPVADTAPLTLAVSGLAEGAFTVIDESKHEYAVKDKPNWKILWEKNPEGCNLEFTRPPVQ